MVGSVDTLTFEQGRLHLELLADSRSPAAEGEWQAALAQGRFCRHTGRTVGGASRRRDRGKTWSRR